MDNPLMLGIDLSEYPIKSDVTPLAIGTLTTTLNILKTSGHLCGFSFRETTVISTAQIDLYDGTDVNSELMVTITLSPGQSTRDWFGMFGLYFKTGLFANVVSGSVGGAVWVRL